MRLIDADALYNSFGASGNCGSCQLDAYKCQYYNEHTLMEFCERIDDAPTVDPVKHGHWIEHDVGLICSECGHYTEAMYDEPFNNEFGKGWALKRPYYCGYCGAKMDEVENAKG